MTPKVSVVIPCRNEERYISKCLDSLLASDYPKDFLEVLIVDGRSRDRTREIIEAYARKHRFIRLLDNPKQSTPAALNRGIRESRGDVVIRMDAHSAFGPNYISRCVELLDRHRADNIGGIIHTQPGAETLMARGIALAMAHPFGVGRSEFRMAETNRPHREVDTVPYGCFRRELFDRIGYFDEGLPQWKGRCNEDFDFNKRIKEAGGRVVLTPEIESLYFARGTLKEFLTHNFNNGVLVTIPLGWNSADFSARHLVPLAFVTLMAVLIPLSFLSPFSRHALFVVGGSYLTLNLYFSFKTALRRRNPAYFLLMPIVFSLLHGSYGLGSLFGLGKAAYTKLVKKPPVIWSRENS
jgi:glycosyltransferase involved in cell wall biosynthesis